MLARGAGVVEGDVGIRAASDDGAAAGERVALAGDLEHRCPHDRALHVLGVDAHDSGGEVRVAFEGDVDGPCERVPLGGGVLLHQLRELVDECGAEPGHPLEVGRGEAHAEPVGNEDALTRDDGGLGVEFAAERRGDLERLQPALEGLGEGAVDDALQALLELVENPQRVPLSADDGVRWCSGL